MILLNKIMGKATTAPTLSHFFLYLFSPVKFLSFDKYAAVDPQECDSLLTPQILFSP
jgi:hypothetical protein